MLSNAEMIKLAGKGNYIETYTGKNFYLDSPEFDPDDIAHATSLQCRFAGHVLRHFSGAKHMCLVHDIMVERGDANPFEGLMHDAHEAYVIDMPSPWKAWLPDYVDIEKGLELKLRRWAGLPDKITDSCKMADWIALYMEAFFLIPSKGNGWMFGSEYRLEAHKMLERNDYWYEHFFQTDWDGYYEWLARYYQYAKVPE